MSILTKNSFELIIDLINAANNSTLDETKVSFGAPAPLTDDPSNHNTRTTVASVRGGGYVGSVNVTYNRLDIALLFNGIDVVIDVPDAVTTADLLPRLNEKYGLGLEVSDISDTNIDKSSGTGSYTHTLVISGGSYAYIGSLSLIVGAEPEVGERLDTVILVNNLSGLLYPNSDTDKAQARVYSWDINGNPISAWLSVRAVGETIVDNALATELNKVTPDLWVYDGDAPAEFNTAGAEVIYAGPNLATNDTNQGYNRIVQIRLSETNCTNVGGVLTLGYTL